MRKLKYDILVLISISTLRQFLYQILHPSEILTLFFIYMLKYSFTQVPVLAIEEHVQLVVYNKFMLNYYYY